MSTKKHEYERQLVRRWHDFVNRYRDASNAKVSASTETMSMSAPISMSTNTSSVTPTRYMPSIYEEFTRQERRWLERKGYIF